MNFELGWADFKAFVDARSLVVQYADINSAYYLFATDLILSFSCTLSKVNAEIASDVSDFENNYKTAGNKPIARTGFMRKGFSATTTQTNTALWTPASGKRIILTGYQFSIHNNTIGTNATAQMFEDTNTSANMIYSNMNAVGANFDVSVVCNPFIPMGVDKAIKATTSAAIRVAGILFGYEV